MDATKLVAMLAPGASVREISAEGGGRRNRVFRLVEESGTASVLKVYANPGRERRERHALEAIGDVEGVPRVIDRGLTADGTAWAKLTDGGGWTLKSLTKNLDVVARAGKILRAVHTSEAPITNLEGSLDGAYVATHYMSTIDRLGRYRRKLQIPPQVLDLAAQAPAPASSEPVTAHTHPTPDKFVVGDDGSVMLVDWEWATLAPPELDVSMAVWHIEQIHGADAGEAFFDGYGVALPKSRLASWNAYHIAVGLLEAGESRDGRLSDLANTVRALGQAVGAT